MSQTGEFLSWRGVKKVPNLYSAIYEQPLIHNEESNSFKKNLLHILLFVSFSGFLKVDTKSTWTVWNNVYCLKLFNIVIIPLETVSHVFRSKWDCIVNIIFYDKTIISVYSYGVTFNIHEEQSFIMSKCLPGQDFILKIFVW